MNQFEALHALIALEEQGSLTASAEYLRTPKSTLSRRISKLEELLNTRLTFEEKGRLSLSKAGLCYVDYARKILAMAHESQAALQRFSQEVSGEIRLQLCSDLPNGWIAKLLNDFLRTYPLVRLRINRLSSLAESSDKDDVLLTCGDSEEIVGFKCIELRAWECKLYVAKHAPLDFELPHCVEQLKHTPWVVRVEDPPTVRLTHQQSKERFSLEHNARLYVNSLSMLAETLAGGYGVGVLPCWVVQCEKYAQHPNLRECLPDWKAKPLQFSTYIRRHETSYTIRTFVDFLRKNFPQRWAPASVHTASPRALPD